jgi:hypothetical protein
MAGRKPNGNDQNCDQAVQGAANSIHDSLLAGDVGRALHTVQDAQAAGHQFQEWNGHLTLSHEYHDFFPTQEEHDAALANSIDLLRNRALNQDFTKYLRRKGQSFCH